MSYNWQMSGWPQFPYDHNTLSHLLIDIANQTGRLQGAVRAVSKAGQEELLLDVLIEEAIKTSAIEGEFLERSDVKSSLKNQLGLNLRPEQVKDLRAKGIAELFVIAKKTFRNRLTKKDLFQWHKLLMQGTLEKIRIGKFRNDPEPMQVVSGPIGKWKVHFEAPPASQVNHEMTQFISWFNDTAPDGCHEIECGPIRSAIAHLYFLSIHPFDDGNGRLGRVLAEKVLAQHQDHPGLFSLSNAIEKQKKGYYRHLENAQKSKDVTAWIKFFLQTVLEAQEDTEKMVDFVLAKAKFFDEFASKLNERQNKVIKRMLQEGPTGFEGGMTAKKYTAIAKTSKATATRDLQELADLGVFVQIGKGRATRYSLTLTVSG